MNPGNDMPCTQCACGFTETADETITDHLLTAFSPSDNRGLDGQVHLEGARGQCLCGLVPGTPGGLDEHFLAVFTTGDSRTPDGTSHAASNSVNTDT
jgi:hypothetical protein